MSLLGGEYILKEIIAILLILFFAFETINWFTLQALRMKMKFQKHHATQEQATRVLKQVRLIYFWLSSDYYFNRLRELYYFVYESPEVQIETKDGLYKSLTRRFVKDLRRVYS
jgi:uncharacterized membrane protein YwzB